MVGHLEEWCRGAFLKWNQKQLILIVEGFSSIGNKYQSKCYDFLTNVKQPKDNGPKCLEMHW
jgi:hypothetical protein